MRWRILNREDTERGKHEERKTLKGKILKGEDIERGRYEKGKILNGKTLKREDTERGRYEKGKTSSCDLYIYPLYPHLPFVLCIYLLYT